MLGIEHGVDSPEPVDVERLGPTAWKTCRDLKREDRLSSDIRN